MGTGICHERARKNTKMEPLTTEGGKWNREIREIRERLTLGQTAENAESSEGNCHKEASTLRSNLTAEDGQKAQIVN